ncbi:MAG: cupin domain-containing protein [Syntrophobacteraceae bacterium]
MRVNLEEIEVHHDHRGTVFEPLAGGSLSVQQNVHAVLTNPGGIRGNHYHRFGTEVATVYGPALIRLRDGEEVQERVLTEGQAVRFTIPAGVAHAFKNIGEKPNLLICFNTEVHDRDNPDVIFDILIAS